MDNIIVDFFKEIIRQIIMKIEYGDIWSFIYVFRLVLTFYFLNQIAQTLKGILAEIRKQNDQYVK